MGTQGIHIQIETAPDYEIPEGIRQALERLAEAASAEAESAEVEGFAAGFVAIPGSKPPGKFGPKEPLAGVCVGGYSDAGFGSCNWVFTW